MTVSSESVDIIELAEDDGGQAWIIITNEDIQVWDPGSRN